MEAVILASCCAVGYMLNKDGKRTRQIDQNVVVSPNDKPSSEIIYDNNRLQKVDEYVRNIAADKHATKVRQMYPYSQGNVPVFAPDDGAPGYPAPFSGGSGGVGGQPASFSVEPVSGGSLGLSAFTPTPNLNATLYAPGQMGNNDANSAHAQFEKNVMLTAGTNPAGLALDPNTGTMISATPTLRRETFQSLAAAPCEAGGVSGSFAAFSASYNPAAESMKFSPFLGGAAVHAEASDMTHTNMQPHFGRNSGQIGNDAIKSRKLEQFTGTAAGDSSNPNEWQPKHEIANPFPTYHQDPNKAFVPTGLIQERTVVADSMAYTPAPGGVVHDSYIDPNTRILPVSLEQRRGANKPMTTYTTDVIPGARGSGRAAPVNPTAPKYDNTRELGYADYIPGRASYTGEASRVLPNAPRMNKEVSLDGYMGGPALHPARDQDTQLIKDSHRNTIENRTTKRIETFEPPKMNARGEMTFRQSGMFNLLDQGREKETKYIGTITGRTKPGDRSNLKAPPTTLKSITTEDRVGPINQSGRFKEDSGYRRVRFDLGATSKSINAINTYVGHAFKDRGNGNRRTKISLNGFDRTLPGDLHPGIVTMATKRGAALRHAKETKTGPVPLMVQDYISNPNAQHHLSSTPSRKGFANGLTKPVTRLQVRTRVHPGKMGNREDGVRTAKIRMSDSQAVDGRVHSGYIPGNLDSLETGVTLKDDAEEIPVDELTRRPRNLHTVLELPTLSRQRNVELENSRLPKMKPRTTTNPVINAKPLRPNKSIAELHPWLKAEPMELDSDSEPEPDAERDDQAERIESNVMG